MKTLEKDKIYNEDCIIGMRKFESESIDLMVTSPPYNIGLDYDSCNDALPWDEYLNWCRSWLTESYRLLKDDGRFAINVLVECGQEDNKKRVSPMVSFVRILEEIGFNITAMPMWQDRTRSTHTAWGSWQSASCPYIYNPFEVVIIGYKKQWKKQKKGMNTISSNDFKKATCGVWDFQPEISGLTIANFPIELPKMCIELLSFKDDIVLDPFMGSGTTACAAKMTGRRFIGFEISSHYHSISEIRIKGIEEGVTKDPMKKVLKDKKKTSALDQFLT